MNFVLMSSDRYLVFKSDIGISYKTVDRFFDRFDLDKSGHISEAEFRSVLASAVKMIRQDVELDRQASTIARQGKDYFVVAGSSKLNAVSRRGVKVDAALKPLAPFATEVLHRNDLKFLWDMFQTIDADQKGTIDLSEFRKHLKRNNREMGQQAASIFFQIDKGRTGKISFQKLLSKLYPGASGRDLRVMMKMAIPADFVRKPKNQDQAFLEEISFMFNVFDDNKSGSLDREEFIHCLGITGFEEEEAGEIFDSVDGDGSGEISFQEFELWYSNNSHLILKQEETLRKAENEDSDED